MVIPPFTGGRSGFNMALLPTDFSIARKPPLLACLAAIVLERQPLFPTNLFFAKSALRG